MTTIANPELPEIIALLQQGMASLAQAETRLQMIIGLQPDVPYMDARTAARVEKLGPVASRHSEFIDSKGFMTRADSLAIRREMYGTDVQATANLFGKKDSNALFWRDRPYGTPVKDDDLIHLTAEGVRIAGLWRAAHDG